MKVSVPSRGILFPNLSADVALKVITKVSVPSRGILFPNLNLTLMMDFVYVSVPSRGILFPNSNTSCQENFQQSFRPLSGHLISKFKGAKSGELCIKLFPSPLGASYFQMGIY